MKKIISVILLATMLFAMLATAVDAAQMQIDEKFTPGDVNDDGAIDAKDSISLKSYVANGGEGDISVDAADITADGEANVRDLFLIKASFVGEVNLAELDKKNASVYKMTIAGNDISEYDIVIPEEALFLPKNQANNDNCTYAAEILREYIGKATGFRPEIVKGQSTKPHMIYCHMIEKDSAEAEALGLVGYEDYIYEVKDGDLHLYGTVRGDSYAAFDILETYLGIKFYAERYTYFPKMRTCDIPEGTRVSHKSPLEFRFSGQSANSDTAEASFFPNRQNGTQMYAYWCKKYGYMTGPLFCNAHSFGEYYLMGSGDDPGPDYPDIRNRYYVKWKSKTTSPEAPYPDIMKNNWQPCASPNAKDTLDSGSPSDYAYMFQGMLDGLQMMTDWGNDVPEMTRLGVHIASASINDNGSFCTCRLCVAKANGGSYKFRPSDNPDDLLNGYTGEYTVDTATRKIQFKKESYSGVYLDLTKRFGRDIQEYYPGLRVMTIIYDHTVPESVRPDERIVLMYCGHSCNQHPFGSGECGDGKTLLGSNNTHDEIELPQWAQMCHEAGATIWFWEYGVNYHYYLAPCPNVMDFWQTYHFILVDCGVDGIYYEGCDFLGSGGTTDWDYNDGEEYNFEGLKDWISLRMMWNPEMTYDEFIELIKDYLYMYYGKGYEYIYQHLMYQQAAGDANEICYVVNFDRPWEMYSREYIAENYETGRAYLDRALEMAENGLQRERIKRLYLSCDFLGLSVLYDEMYTNGNEQQRATYEKRYSEMLDYIHKYNYPIFGDESVYSAPDECDFSINPMIQFYETGSRRPGITP